MNNTNFRVVVRRMGLNNILYWRPEFVKTLTIISEQFGYNPESRTAALTMVFTNILKREGMDMVRRDIGFKAARACIDVMDNNTEVELAIARNFEGVDDAKVSRAHGLVHQYISARKLEVSKPNIHRNIKKIIINDDQDAWS